MVMSPAQLCAGALDAAVSPVVIVECSTPYDRVSILYANRAFCALYGLEAAPDPGSHARVFSPDGDPTTEVRLAAAVRDGRAAAVTGVAKLADGSECRLEARVAPLDASAHKTPTAAIYLRTLSAPTTRPLDADLALAALDITADELAWVEASLYGVGEAFPGVALIVDDACRVRFCAGEGLGDLGLTREGLEGRALAEALPSTMVEAIAPFMLDALDGRAQRFEFDVADRVYEGRAAAVRIDTGRLIGAVLTLVDVTDARTAFGLLAETTEWRPPTGPARWGL